MGKSGKQTKANSKEQEQQSQDESNPYGKIACEKKLSGVLQHPDFVGMN